MKDKRLEKIAKNLLNYSIKLKKDESVLIKGHFLTKPLLKELIKEANNIGANVFYEIMDDELSSLTSKKITKKAIALTLKHNFERYKDIDCFVSIYATENDYEGSIVSDSKKQEIRKKLRPLSDMIVNEKRWVLMDWPTYGLAQKSKMSYDDFSDYVFEICSYDYEKMLKDMIPLKELLEKTDKVRIKSPGTDLEFSIKNIPAIPCAGDSNIPDGEVFTAPVKNSVNGIIKYNTPSPYNGKVYNNVELKFKDGKIIEATADNDVESLREIFETDEGAKYIGEFAIGVNPKIMHPIGNILFDEKIAGSFHFTPGACYKGEADNGNESAIHWDLVQIQRKEYGGGEIYFDDKLIRKDGIFILEELKNLNF